MEEKKNTLLIKIAEKELLNIKISDLNSNLCDTEKSQVRECAKKLLQLIGEDHQDFKKISDITMQTGLLWIGDAKNGIIERLHEKPEDLGYHFHDLVNIYEDRSGEDAFYKESLDWLKKQNNFIEKNEKWIEFRKKHGSDPSLRKNGTILSKKMENLYKILEKAYENINPFKPKTKLKRYAEFKHNDGSKGLGIIAKTPQRDSNYPVFAQYKDGKIKKILIDMSKEEIDEND